MSQLKLSKSLSAQLERAIHYPTISKTIMVVGVPQGIGLAIVLACMTEKASHLILVGPDDGIQRLVQEQLTSLANEWKTTTLHTYATVDTDLGRIASVFFDVCSNIGAPDTLILCNHQWSFRKSILKCTADDLERCLEDNEKDCLSFIRNF